MSTPESQQIVLRFFKALDAIVAKKELRGAATFCRLYDIDRRNFHTLRKDPDRKIFEVGWLTPLVTEYGVNAKWLLTGIGTMFN